MLNAISIKFRRLRDLSLTVVMNDICAITVSQSRLLLILYLGTSIRELDFYISDSYMQGVYDSCKSVSNPATGELAMDVICSGAIDCSAHK